MKKITLATVKAFIKKNQGNLFINVKSSFDGSIDGLSYEKEGYKKAESTTDCFENTLGIKGAWFVGSSRDYFTAYETVMMTGIEVSNSCGNFVICISKEQTNQPEPTKDLQHLSIANDTLTSYVEKPEGLFDVLKPVLDEIFLQPEEVKFQKAHAKAVTEYWKNKPPFLFPIPFDNPHFKNWQRTTDGESNFFGIASEKNWLMRVQVNGELTVTQQNIIADLIENAVKMAQFILNQSK